MTINAETAVSYAALILADEGLAITSDKLQTLLKAANVEVEPIWSTILAKALEGKDIKQILTSVENSGPATSDQNGKDGKDDGDGHDSDGASAHSYHSSDDGDSDSDIGLSLFD